MTPQRFLSPEQIAAQGGPSPKRQAKLRIAGEFCPFHKIGGRVFYTVEDWEAYLRNQRRRSTGELTPAAA